MVRGEGVGTREETLDECCSTSGVAPSEVWSDSVRERGVGALSVHSGLRGDITLSPDGGSPLLTNAAMTKKDVCDKKCHQKREPYFALSR